MAGGHRAFSRGRCIRDTSSWAPLATRGVPVCGSGCGHAVLLCLTVLRTSGTLVCMAETLTIRLGAADRAALEAAARGQGKGLSTFVREIAEAEARRMRREAIRAEGDRVVGHLAEHPEARSELDEIGTPLSDLP